MFTRTDLPSDPPSPVPAAPPGAAAGDRPAGTRLVGLLLVGAAVSVSLGVYGRLHTPSGVAVNVAGFSGPQEAKAWLASLVVVLAVAQVGSAFVMYRGAAGRRPRWVGPVHRWSGRAAFLVSVPVAVHCLYALGLQTFDLRVLAHSLAGCAFYGAFTVKMLSLSRTGLPGWLLPVLGGAVFALLVAVWLTSSFWFFTTIGVRA
ncbi:MAG: DUF6529 family protein [Kineosporiaceae bacterium]|jgi:hypothetical protein